MVFLKFFCFSKNINLFQADKLKKTRIQNVIPKVEPRRDLFLELIHAGKWNKVMEKLETEGEFFFYRKFL